MNPPESSRSAFEHKAFVVLLVVVSLAFFWILWPYYGAVFWGTAISILSTPFYRWLLARMPGKSTGAALLTLLGVLVIVIIPLAFIAGALFQQSVGIYRSIESGELNFGEYLQQILAVLPAWVTDLLDRFGLNNVAALRERLATSVTQVSRLVATQALSVGQITLDFAIKLGLALYLSFFLLRDGVGLARQVRDAIPLAAAHKRNLLSKFVTVVRATIKGNILVAAAQGALGGIAFWFLGVQGALLWAVLMAFLSLIPAVGAGLVWLPVAIYFLATGSVVKGAGLIAYGVLVIGLVDNVLRPILVGKDTKMPDYVVLISTLGGLAIFGLNGFVIGPMIAAMFIAVWAIFVYERAAIEQTDAAAGAVPAAAKPPESAAPAAPRQPERQA